MLGLFNPAMTKWMWSVQQWIAMPTALPAEKHNGFVLMFSDAFIMNKHEKQSFYCQCTN